jgi:GNAT superfamily N-acetyltransferase
MISLITLPMGRISPQRGAMMDLDNARNSAFPVPAPPHIRPAVPADVPLLLALIRELAEYERLAHEVVGDEELVRRHLFGDHPAAEAVIAENETGETAGFALYFTTFSTFACRPGIWLEDLYVRPSHRRQGTGRALLTYLARLAVTRGCARVEWSVLDWNQSAISFYRSLGARPLDEWTTQRLENETLLRLAAMTT